MGANKDNLEGGVVEHVRSVEGPKEVKVSGDVNDEIEELRLEGDTACALSRWISLLPADSVMQLCFLHLNFASSARV